MATFRRVYWVINCPFEKIFVLRSMISALILYDNYVFRGCRTIVRRKSNARYILTASNQLFSNIVTVVFSAPVKMKCFDNTFLAIIQYTANEDAPNCVQLHNDYLNLAWLRKLVAICEFHKRVVADYWIWLIATLSTHRFFVHPYVR